LSKNQTVFSVTKTYQITPAQQRQASLRKKYHHISLL